MRELWCCVCINMATSKEQKELPLTIINGFLICEEHEDYAGPNEPTAKWLKENE